MTLTFIEGIRLWNPLCIQVTGNKITKRSAISRKLLKVEQKGAVKGQGSNQTEHGSTRHVQNQPHAEVRLAPNVQQNLSHQYRQKTAKVFCELESIAREILNGYRENDLFVVAFWQDIGLVFPLLSYPTSHVVWRQLHMY